MDRFPGRYVGTVADNDDPKGLCRLKATVPEVLGEETSGWCLPSLPFAGDGVGLALVPPAGAVVFVEWPAGDLTRVPVWSGAAWADGTGVEGAGPDRILLVTTAGNRLEIRDTADDEAIVLTAASGAEITLDPSGVSVVFGGQSMTITDSSISFNDGALEIS
ncbi:phage baseplate assembly protein V [Dactylosporangium cerinum]|uniref:Phage baseplate assembly protein V n=1 Tax=Dactylosporangium cerinum TaxID=1434730 RepID=A0ABV9VT55_9ACTN